MWPHFGNLLADSWHGVLTALSTSTLAIILFSLAAPVATFFVTLVVVSKLNAEKSFVEHLKQSVIPTLIGFAVPLVLLSCVFGWKMVETVYNDHQYLVHETRELINAPKPVCPSCPAGDQKSTSQRPIVIENKIDTAALVAAIAAIQKQEHQTQSPLKASILALSKDILTFALERGRQQPPRSVHLTPEVMEKAWQEGVKFSDETESQYSLKFGPRLASIFAQLQSKGIDVDKWPMRCSGVWAGSSIYTIQECGSQLSVFADQVDEQ